MKKISWFVILSICVCSASLASNAPNNKVCRVGPTGGVMNTPGCVNKSEGDNCTSVRASEAKCLNATGRYKDSEGTKNGTVLTCKERICKDGYILWLHDLPNGGYQPYGLCQSKSAMQKLCDQGKGCPPGCKCELDAIDYTWDSGWTKGKKTSAYYEDKMCVCKEVNKEIEKVSCKYSFKAFCPDNTPLKGYAFIDKEINMTQTELNDSVTKQWYSFTDDDIKACANGVVMDDNDKGQLSDAARKLFTKMFNKDTQVVKDNGAKWIKENCYQLVDFDNDMSYTGGAGGASFDSTYTTGANVNSAEINNAKSVLSAFFAKAESDVSVWKNAEGKFNTARLASDLGAGIVLGTVGGVVSSVVIKKAQVKKGFESLQCYMHGYKVADWGDVFEASLRTR